MDVIWAFPVLLLAIALGIALAVGGLQIGPIHDLRRLDLDPDPDHRRRLRRPTWRGRCAARCSSLREKEFVEAAVAQGAGPLRVMFGELLPNLWSTIIVFFTLNIANNMLLESALSFLGVGVQPPNSSWGTMIATGYRPDHQRAAADDHPRHDDPAHGALAQRLRRRPARRARPALEGAARGPRRHRSSRRGRRSDGPLRRSGACSGWCSCSSPSRCSPS